MGWWFLRIFLVILISFGFSYIPIRIISDDFFSVMFTVIGIMFPLALCQIMAFPFNEIENDNFVNKRRNQLSDIRIAYIILFAISTGVFAFKTACFNINWKWIRFDIKSLFFVYLLFCLGYYVISFIEIAKLKDEVDDKIRHDKKKQKEMMDNLP